jgi:hypothetical protein
MSQPGALLTVDFSSCASCERYGRRELLAVDPSRWLMIRAWRSASLAGGTRRFSSMNSSRRRTCPFCLSAMRRAPAGHSTINSGFLAAGPSQVGVLATIRPARSAHRPTITARTPPGRLRQVMPLSRPATARQNGSLYKAAPCGRQRS